MRHLPSKQREFYIPKGSTTVSDKLSDAVAYLYTTPRNDKPAAAVFSGKAYKPTWHFTFASDAAREKRVREFFEAVRANAARVAARNAERKAFVHNVQVGDIFCTCWGYDQTNREAFEVIAVRGKYATLREVAMASETNGQSDRVVPQSGAFLSPCYDGDEQGLPIRRLIQRGYNDQPHIKIDNCRSGTPWGKREPVTGTIIGRSMDRTASGWGH